MGAAAILQLVVQYGPQAVTAITNLVQILETKGQLTLAEVEAEFAALEPYSDFNITAAKSSPPSAT